MKQTAGQQIHVLQIPVDQLTAVVPISNTAEVINVGEVTPIPCSPNWVLGAVAWRKRAIPVITFESMLGRPLSATTSRSKIVVFNPLQGRRDWEFFGMLATSEPHPAVVDNTQPLQASTTDYADNPYVAAEIRLQEGIGLIPNLVNLTRLFYP